MTRKEIIQILALLKAAYPLFYKDMSKQELENIVGLWFDIFQNDNPIIVVCAVKDLIKTHSGFPPAIANVRNKMNELISLSSGEQTYEELWHILKKAVSNGYYGYTDEYTKLPEVLQKYVGQPENLRTWAKMDEEIFNSVVHGQFLKQIGIIKDRQKYSDSLPPEVKKFIASAGIKQISEPEEPENNNDTTYIL